MTNAEAIRIINQYDCNFYWTDGEKIPTEDLIEAFYMAEKALKEIPEFMTVREAAQEMRVSCPTVYRMASRAEIPVIRIGGRLLIPRKAYDEWLKRKCRNAASSVRTAAARDTSTPACRRIGACNNDMVRKIRL